MSVAPELLGLSVMHAPCVVVGVGSDRCSVPPAASDAVSANIPVAPEPSASFGRGRCPGGRRCITLRALSRLRRLRGGMSRGPQPGADVIFHGAPRMRREASRDV